MNAPVSASMRAESLDPAAASTSALVLSSVPMSCPRGGAFSWPLARARAARGGTCCTVSSFATRSAGSVIAGGLRSCGSA
jgi:hypothetical protein